MDAGVDDRRKSGKRTAKFVYLFSQKISIRREFDKERARKGRTRLEEEVQEEEKESNKFWSGRK